VAYPYAMKLRTIEKTIPVGSGTSIGHSDSTAAAKACRQAGAPFLRGRLAS
jgi:hypothetical protein